MSSETAVVAAVLADFGVFARTTRALGSAGGFSGARFWRVEGHDGAWCLRRYARQHPTENQLAWIHAALHHATDQGCTVIPRPRRSPTGSTWVRRDGYLWELASWMPGLADYVTNPGRAKLVSAMQALAQLHRALASFPQGVPGRGPSPGLTERLTVAHRYQRGGIDRIRDAVRSGNWPQLAAMAPPLLAEADRQLPEIKRRLQAEAGRPVPLQVCVRDIWHAHILFTDERVTGIVDFDAMRIECPAADFGRLVGSLVADDLPSRRKAAAAYLNAASAFPDGESRWVELANLFDDSAVVLGGLFWLKWIYCDGRRFDHHQRPAIESRLGEFLERLRHRQPGD